MVYKVEYTFKSQNILTMEQILKIQEEIGHNAIVKIDYEESYFELPFENQKQLTNLRQQVTKLCKQTRDEELSKERKKQIGKRIQQLQYQMQQAWGFDKKRQFHSYWLHLKGCTCPKVDNWQMYGHSYILDENCPYHGD